MNEVEYIEYSHIEGMSDDELVKWFRIHRYTDPLLQRLAKKAAEQAHAPDAASRRG